MKKIEISKLTQQEKEAMGIPPEATATGPWSVWTCGPSAFPWHYDETEKAYFYEGRVKVLTDHNEVEIHAGDFAVFPAGLDCRWEVFEKVKKVYKFE